jgi:hypothetical protein
MIPPRRPRGLIGQKEIIVYIEIMFYMDTSSPPERPLRTDRELLFT